MKIPSPLCLLSALLAVTGLLFVSPLVAEEAATGVIEKAATVIQDGAEVGQVEAGKTVQILGRNDETGEVLISFTGKDGKAITGLVPGSAFVATSKQPAIAPTPAPEPGE